MTRVFALEALQSGPRTPEALDQFFATHTFPIVEGNSITFVYRGDAEAVHLKHWVYGLPSSQSLARLDGTNLWYLTRDLPAGSRVEYKLEVVRDGHGNWIEDPLNPNRARDPFGANSVAHGTGYQVPEWIHPDPEAPHGTIDEIRSSGTPARRSWASRSACRTAVLTRAMSPTDVTLRPA